MDILIWKSHGDICVYDVSTPEKLKAQIEMAIACVQGWHIDEKIAVVQEHINKHPDNSYELRRAFRTLTRAIGDDSDAFEAFYMDALQ